MKLLADEGIEREIVDALRAAGFDTVYVAEHVPTLSDTAVLDLARTEGRILITADKDFGELVFRQHRASAGIVLVRLAGLPGAMKAAMVVEVLRSHSPEVPGAFTVVSPGPVRIRKRS